MTTFSTESQFENALIRPRWGRPFVEIFIFLQTLHSVGVLYHKTNNSI